MSHRPRIDEHETIPLEKQEETYSGRDLWRPSSPTVVYVGTIPFGLAVIEMTQAALMRYVNGKYIRESEWPARSVYFPLPVQPSDAVSINSNWKSTPWADKAKLAA